MKLEVAALKIKLLPLLILCLILIFNSCEGGEETTAPPETTGDPAIETTLTLVSGDGEAQYALILPENSNGDMRTAVNSFADKLTDLYGAKFEVKKNSSLAEGKNLIMIGAQEDTEYASYFADVPYRDYAVKITDDGNIVLTEATDGKVDIRANMTVLGEKTERGFMLDGTTYIVSEPSSEK